MLTDIVRGIPDALRARISSIWVEQDDAGGWRARVGYSLMVESYPGEVTEAGPYQIAADLDNLPRGVTARALNRWPDSLHPLDVWGDDPTPHIEHQIRALSDSGLLGTLNYHNHGDRWLIKTHAGSDAERGAWVRGLTAK